MRRSVLLMFGLSLIVIVRVHCQENIGPIVNKMNGLSDEMAHVKRDLLRVEEKITIQIDFAKLSLGAELNQDIKENVKNAIAEALQGESIHEIVRNQVVSEVSQLKRGHLSTKRQLHDVQNSLRDIQKERDEYKEALEKANKHSREFKCVIYPEGTGTETSVSNNFTHSHKHLDQSVSNLSAELQSTKGEQESLNISVSETRKGLVSTRSEMKIVQASVNATVEDVSSTKAELTLLKASLKAAEKDILSTKSELKIVKASVNATREDDSSTKAKLALFQASLEAAERDILSTKSEIGAVSTSLSVVRQEKMATTSRFSDVQKRIVKLEKVMNNADPSVAFEVTQTKHPHNLQPNQKFRFDTVVLNNGGGYHAGTGVFTAPVSGTYLFWANILPDKGALHTLLFKGHARLFVAYCISEHIQCSLTYVVKVNRGQKVWFQAPHYLRQIHGDSHSGYGGALIHAHQLSR